MPAVEAMDYPDPPASSEIGLKRSLDTMLAYHCVGYGGPDVLRLVELPRPTPKADEMLVRVYATSVTSGDCRVRSMQVPRGLGLIARLALGFNRPRQPILGTEFAGVVEAVGPNVTRFAVGDAVCGFPGGKMGCYAEYCCIKENGRVVHKPPHLSFVDAAGLWFGGSTALHFLRAVQVASGQKWLIIGASGGVGSSLVQLAAQEGVNVTAVTSTANVDLVRSLGAEDIIDYTAEDFTRNGQQYDVIIDVVGASSFGHCRHMLVDKGRFVPVAGGLADMLAALWAPLLTGKKVIAGPAEERVADMGQIAALTISGALKPVTDRIFPFTQMTKAHAYVDTGRKKGAVAIILADEPEQRTEDAEMLGGELN